MDQSGQRKQSVQANPTNLRRQMLMGTTVEKSPIEKVEPKEANPEDVKRRVMASYAPKSEADYKRILEAWIGRFFSNHLKEDKKQRPNAKTNFQIEWGQTTARLSADVEGDMTKAIMDSHKLL